MNVEQLSEKIAALYFFIFPHFSYNLLFPSIYTILPTILRFYKYEQNRNHRTSQDI